MRNHINKLLFMLLVKIFNEPLKIEGKTKINTRNDNYQKEIGTKEV